MPPLQPYDINAKLMIHNAKKKAEFDKLINIWIDEWLAAKEQGLNIDLDARINTLAKNIRYHFDNDTITKIMKIDYWFWNPTEFKEKFKEDIIKLLLNKLEDKKDELNLEDIVF